MIETVLKAPINLYFDVTPIGRIMNRFSKDLSQIEISLSYYYGSTLALISNTLQVIVISIITFYWFILIVPLIIYFILKVYKYQIQAFRETVRVESLTKSPLISFV